MDITLAKIMFLDRKGKAFVLDADDIRRDKQTLRDRLDFLDEDDFDKSKNYNAKWRDCQLDCEEAHVHTSYYPARILCLAADLDALNAKSIRFLRIPFEDESLSPMPSQSSSFSTQATPNDSDEEYPEFLNNSDEEYTEMANEDDEDDRSSDDDVMNDQSDPRETKKARRLQLAKAKMEIQKGRSLDNVRKYHQQRSGKGNPPMVQSTGLPAVQAPAPEQLQINAQNRDAGQRTDGSDTLKNPAGAVGHGENGLPLPNANGVVVMQAQNIIHNDGLQALRAADNVQPQAPQLRDARQRGNDRAHLENPLSPLVRKTRYNIVDGQYIISENLPVDVETYEAMRMRPFKDSNLFIRDSIGLIWSGRELACRSLAVEKCQKDIPGLRFAEPEKIQLVTTMVCNWYEDDKGIKITQKKRDKVYSQVRRKLSDVIRDKKAAYFPDLVRRKRRREDDEGADGAMRPIPDDLNQE